jgi:hypothetical protein
MVDNLRLNHAQGSWRPESDTGPKQPRDPTLLSRGYFFALDARTGQLLWQRSPGGLVYLSVFAYALRQTTNE